MSLQSPCQGREWFGASVCDDDTGQTMHVLFALTPGTAPSLRNVCTEKPAGSGRNTTYDCHSEVHPRPDVSGSQEAPGAMAEVQGQETKSRIF